MSADWIGRCGISPTPWARNVSRSRRSNVPWSPVQCVVGYRQMGADSAALVLDSGERLVLRVPSTFWGSKAATAAKYQEDFHRLGQWWLAHRGPSWRPLRHEAPGAPTPE